uniref:Neuralized E3 ubiquitin protein ligase 1 n=1 Tax=Macaca fascicularis TaxID=9541 RepID=A0A7N9CME4_MACFA
MTDPIGCTSAGGGEAGVGGSGRRRPEGVRAACACGRLAAGGRRARVREGRVGGAWGRGRGLGPAMPVSARGGRRRGGGGAAGRGDSVTSRPAQQRWLHCPPPEMGGQITRSTLHDSIGGPFPVTSHRCHHKQKHCPAVLPGGGLPATPLLFHPHTKGSQILMDLSHKAVKRQASFCNAITFSNRPVLIYEQVRLKITKKQCCWSGALRLGFTSKDPSRIHPDSLPKYACPDLVSQSGFWAKALPEEFANEGNIIAFWVDKKGRVFHRINDSAVMLFFSGVRTADPLWALVDVYGLTRGVQLLDSELVLPDCLRPRSFTALRRPSLRREADDARLSVSLCDLNVPGADSDEAAPAAGCPIPQNSLNSQHSRALPAQLDGDLRFHALRAGAHVRILDEQTVARVEHGRDERALVFTSRPVRVAETIFVKVTRCGARPGALSFGVTTCDPGTLRPADLPFSPEALVDRKEFWAVCRVPGPCTAATSWAWWSTPTASCTSATMARPPACSCAWTPRSRSGCFSACMGPSRRSASSAPPSWLSVVSHHSPAPLPPRQPRPVPWAAASLTPCSARAALALWVALLAVSRLASLFHGDCVGLWQGCGLCVWAGSGEEPELGSVNLCCGVISGVIPFCPLARQCQRVA